MPIDRDHLARHAADYIAGMTSIRGRRVQRLVLRELARAEIVLAGHREDAAPVLVGLRDGGGIDVVATDGTGPAAVVHHLPSITGGRVDTAFDLLKDSLPVLRWTLHLPALAAIDLPAAGLDAATLAHAHRLLTMG